MSSIKEYRLGRWAAILVTAEVAVFAAELIWYLVAPSDAANIVSYIACLLLAPSFVTMIACTPLVSVEGSRTYTRAALGLAAMYAVLCSSVYYLQLTVIRLNTYAVSADAMRLLLFTTGSPARALDMLGYTFMGLSTLALVPALAGRGQVRVLKLFCGLNGLLAIPTLVFPALMVSQQGSGASDAFGCIVLLVWCAIFLPIPIISARLFRAGQRAAGSSVVLGQRAAKAAG